MPRKTKQIQHSKERAHQRHNINLTETDIAEFVRIIRSGEAQRIWVESNRTQVYLVPFGNGNLPVVYDRKRGTIASVLPKDAWEVKVSLGDESMLIRLSDAAEILEISEASVLWNVGMKRLQTNGTDRYGNLSFSQKNLTEFKKRSEEKMALLYRD